MHTYVGGRVKESDRALVPLKIGELAAATQVTRDTLRYYERLGLLTTPTRTSGGFRLYDHEAPEQVRFVKQAQALGLELSEIRQLVGLSRASGLAQCRQVRPLLHARLAELDARLTELRLLRRTLGRALEECEHRLTERPDAVCPVVEELGQRAAKPHKSRDRTARGEASRPRRRRS